MTRALVVLVGILWGCNWPAGKLALGEITPWTFRLLGLVLGTAALAGLALMRGARITLPRGRAAWHLTVAGLLNIAGFNLFAAFAQLGAATSRVAVIAYTMPIWAALFSWLALGDRLSWPKLLGLGLGAAGLAALILPFLGAGIPIGMLYALGAAVTWAAGTVYVKWAGLTGDPINLTFWQFAVGTVAVAAGLVLFEPAPHLWPLHWPALLGAAYNVVFGMTLAYVVWFEIVGRLTPTTASLGILLAPVIGVLGSLALLGDRPMPADIVGFLLVLAAAACALLLPDRRPGAGTSGGTR